MYCDGSQSRVGRRMTKKILLVLVALLAFESFGFGFLLDAAKLAIGVSVMAVQNIRNCGRTSSENAPKIVSVTPADGAKDSHMKFASADGVPLVPCVCTFRTK